MVVLLTVAIPGQHLQLQHREPAIIKKVLCLFLTGILLNLIQCSLDESVVLPPQVRQLQKIAEYPLDIPEPSGMAFSKSLNCLWTVSDQTNQIYRISLTGSILETLPFIGEDLEGITYDSLNQTLWVVQEPTREIIQVNLAGQELQRHSVTINGSIQNSGLEGVCIDQNHCISVVNEKDPGVYIILDSQYNIAESIQLNFANDYSDICINPEQTDCFWVLSDENRTLFNWDKHDGVLESFPLNIQQPEGVAFDPVAKRFYIVSDLQEKLYIYDMIDTAE